MRFAQMAHSRVGYWLSTAGVFLTILYLMAVIAALTTGNFPPQEPYRSVIGGVSLVSVPLMILLWVVIRELASQEARIFTTGSLALMIVFGTLTSINRYVSLTVVPQAVLLGKTEGLFWFQPYGWPSIMAAMEVLAWGFYLGLAFFCLAPAFRNGKIEKAIFYTLILSGIFCLLAALGQVLNNVALNMLGILAWGPGLITLFALFTMWFKR